MENLPKLFEAAKKGSIKSLKRLLKADPSILAIAAVSCFNESSPLHIAALLGHVGFVKEIVRVKPGLVDELNSQKSTPLHLASAEGHVEVVRALLSVNQRACLARDINEQTPLHLAAAQGRVEVVKVLLKAQPDAAYRGKSILHLCVEWCQLEALQILVRALGDEEAFINDSVDVDGNTVLHLAVADKQVEMVRLLVSTPALEVNAVNKKGLTALDVLILSRRDERNSEIEKTLKHGGGQWSTTLETNNNARANKNKENRWMDSLKEHEDCMEKTKAALMVAALLVVASLFATMAFQIGVNPPGEVWQDDNATYSDGYPVEAGSSVLGHKYSGNIGFFYIINTVALIASLSIIMLLMSGFRLTWKFFALILMLITWISISIIALFYLLVITALTPGHKVNLDGHVIFVTVIVWVIVWVILMPLLLIAHTIRLIVKLLKKMRKTFKE